MEDVKSRVATQSRPANKRDRSKTCHSTQDYRGAETGPVVPVVAKTMSEELQGLHGVLIPDLGCAITATDRIGATYGTMGATCNC